MDQSRVSWNQIAAWLSRVEALTRFASPSLKVEMRYDERGRVGKMPGEIGLQTGKLWLADQLAAYRVVFFVGFPMYLVRR